MEGQYVFLEIQTFKNILLAFVKFRSWENLQSFVLLFCLPHVQIVNDRVSYNDRFLILNSSNCFSDHFTHTCCLQMIRYS
jgi:hypothetical protein